jgi:hypothetical protein
MGKGKRNKKAKKKKEQPLKDTEQTITYHCLQCDTEEEIPKEVVEYFDLMDSGDPSVPPRFSCERCGGEMRPKEPLVDENIDDIF